MKKVLIITYYWPPASGPGVQRFLKFVKYFRDFGIEPSVLTVKDGSYSSVDETLLNDVPEGIKVYTTKTMEPFKIYNALRGKKGKSVEVGMGNIKNPDTLFKKFSNHIRSNYFIPDARVGWNRYALKKAKSIVEKEEIDTIITTGPPHSTHLIGNKLKNQHSNIKWIADFRDPWTSLYYEKYLNRSESSMLKNQQLEDTVLAQTDHLVVISQGMKDEFVNRAKQISVIPNGYDAADIKSSHVQAPDKFTLSYIGNYKVNQNIDALWSALKSLKESHPEFSNSFDFHITGNVNQEIKSSIENYELDDIVTISDFVRHDEAVQRMQSSHMLYLPIPQSENNKLILTGKIFEYMASHTPILSIGPVGGNAAHVLQDCNRGQMLDYQDGEKIKQAILDKYTAWKENRYAKEESKAYEKYNRRSLTEKYAALLKTK